MTQNSRQSRSVDDEVVEVIRGTVLDVEGIVYGYFPNYSIEAMRKSCVVFSERYNGGTVHHWPSNFFIEPDGTCVESEFQAEKFYKYGSPFTGNAVANMPAWKAKRWGRERIHLNAVQRATWDRESYDRMYELVYAKFEDHKVLRTALLATGDGIIVEENWWHDDIWGHCTCREHFWRIGKNKLGRILMEVRHEFGGPEMSTIFPTWGNFTGWN